MGYVKGGCLWAIIKWIFVVSLAFTIWTMGVVGALFLTYGALSYVTAGQDMIGAITYLSAQSPQVIISEFGATIFGNLPFADFVNAVFITHVTPSLANVVQDVVTSALAGLILYLIARLNLLFSAFIKNRLMMGAIISVMIVFSIGAALVATTYIGILFTGTQLLLMQCAIILASVLVHTFFLLFSLRGIGFLRILLHTVMDLVQGIINNVFLYLCSYVFMYVVPGFGLPFEIVLPYSLLAAFIIFAIYSYLIDKLTSFVWFKASPLSIIK